MSERIKILMMQHDLTSAELVRRSGLSRGSIHKLVNGGEPNPRLATLRTLARAFNMSVSQLLMTV